jgi:hypothetical protein
VEAVKAPEAAGAEEGTVIVAGEEEQPYSTAVFVAADEAEDGGDDGEYCRGNALVRVRVIGNCIENLRAP